MVVKTVQVLDPKGLAFVSASGRITSVIIVMVGALGREARVSEVDVVSDSSFMMSKTNERVSGTAFCEVQLLRTQTHLENLCHSKFFLVS